ncbi:DUF6602 domain-containing protein [Luteibacter aegosomatissinici]|uniref:DUF6602 domain-containing protein n=1 Tax=Luteibacter aegosomatissinici TaxID=2911539 RepID=UPI001FFBBBAD|nr:DUF6602 domain-containing protein [Luteibacter aegosomatissinici]UPG95093.1 hypothetical protein L2Y97_03015 [Luteibacter aegosomatissinici]
MAKQKKLLVNYADGALDALRAQYQMTKVISHSVTAGAAREAVLRDFLVAHLPNMSTAMSGVIFDANDRFSKQQDIVFVLKSFPRLPFVSGSDLIYVEGVIATIEVKTVITAADWRRTIGPNIASVRALTPSSKDSAVMGDLGFSWDESQIFSAVVTYGGSSLQSIQGAILMRPEVEWPDVYLDLGQGMLVRRTSGLIPGEDGAAFVTLADPAVAFAHFLIFLTRITSRLTLRDVEWGDYLY